MCAATYQEPVSQLFKIGRPKPLDPTQTVDYIETYGFTEENIPELLRLATDMDLNWQDDLEGYAGIHAYRSVGQFKSEETIKPLIKMLDDEDYDWFLEDSPFIFAMIGPGCIPGLTEYLQSDGPGPWSKASAARGLVQIAKTFPDQRDQCVQNLTEALSRHAQQPPELNGSLVAKLLNLQAVEAIDVIEKAYKEGPMDEMVCGSFATVQIELGLAKKSDFSEEELRYQIPEQLKPLHEMADMMKQMTEQSQSITKQSKKAQVKSGFSAQASKGKKAKKKKKKR